MKIKYVSGMIALSLVLEASPLYTDTYMSRSGIVMAPIETGLPQRVDGTKLLHWRGYVVRSHPLYFVKDSLRTESKRSLEEIKELITQNSSKIRYISLIGHSASVVDEENRIQLGGLAKIFHPGQSGALSKQEAIARVNARLKRVYKALRSIGVSSNKIYSENRLDRQTLSTEATREGHARNNRIEVALYATAPLHLQDLKIQFALDSDKILPQYNSRLQSFARMLQRNPRLKVTIVGHTDRRGGYAYNMDLSKRRAEAVKRRLTALGVGAERIRTEGRGYTQPLVSGKNDAAYKKNRRIEAVIYP